MTLPAVIGLHGAVYTVVAADSVAVAARIAAMDWQGIVPGLLADGDAETVHARIADPRDDLDRSDCADAARVLAARLCGLAQGIAGWRMAVKVCSALIYEWPQVAGNLLRHGTDPAIAPLWQTCAVMLSMIREGVKEEDLPGVLRSLQAPLPGEPVARRSGSRSVAPFNRREAQAAWRARMQARRSVG